MANYKRAKFERRMKAHRDHLRKKEQESIEKVDEERKATSEKDKKRLLDLWQKITKKE